MKPVTFFLLVFSLTENVIFGQIGIEGHILDDGGLPLPGATVYIEDLNTGTNANAEGYFFIQLEKGTYYTEADKLYTKGDGQIEKMVRYQLTGSDTLMLEMNRQGTYEQLYLKRN